MRHNKLDLRRSQAVLAPPSEVKLMYIDERGQHGEVKPAIHIAFSESRRRHKRLSSFLMFLRNAAVRDYRAFALTAIIAFTFSIMFLSGCGGVQVSQKANTVIATPSTIAFGNVAVGQTATASVTLQNRGLAAVQIDDLSVSGQSFSIAGASFPIQLAASTSATVKLTFTPTAAGSVTGPLMITTSVASTPAAIANITGTGTPGVSALTCSVGFLATVGTDSCSVKLNVAASSGGFVVNLASNNAAVGLPSSLTVPANATTASFTATVAAVSSLQTVVLTATGSGTSETFSIMLGTPGSRAVQLTWNPPGNSNDPIAGYDVYRSTDGVTYQLLNGAIESQTTYLDAGIQGGINYNYYVVSVDAAGARSVPSNMTTVAVP